MVGVCLLGLGLELQRPRISSYDPPNWTYVGYRLPQGYISPT